MTPEEQRVFDEIVSGIDLKTNWRTRRMESVYTWRRLLGVLLAVAGFAMLITGVELKNTVIGIAGWLLGLAAITWLVTDKTRKVSAEPGIFENPFAEKNNRDKH